MQGQIPFPLNATGTPTCSPSDTCVHPPGSDNSTIVHINYTADDEVNLHIVIHTPASYREGGAEIWAAHHCQAALITCRLRILVPRVSV